MRTNKLVIVDADAIVAQAFKLDSNHDLAVEVSLKLSEKGMEILYPVSAILEAVTVLQAKLNNKALAYEVASVLVKPNKRIVNITQPVLDLALTYFSPTASKKKTFFDCVVVAMAEVNKAEMIFSFDSFYKSKGFRLATELL